MDLVEPFTISIAVKLLQLLPQAQQQLRQQHGRQQRLRQQHLPQQQLRQQHLLQEHRQLQPRRQLWELALS